MKRKLLEETPVPEGSFDSEDFGAGYLKRYIDMYSIYGLSCAFIVRFAILRLKRQRNEVNSDLLEKLSYHEKACSVAVKTYDLQVTYHGCNLLQEFISTFAQLEVDLTDGELKENDYKKLELFRTIAKEAFLRNEQEKRERMHVRSQAGFIASSTEKKVSHSELYLTGRHTTDEYKAAPPLRNMSSIANLMGFAKQAIVLPENNSDED